MTGWADTATVFSAFQEIMDGAFRRLRGTLPDAIQPEGPTLNAFEGFAGAGGAGLSVFVLARQPDGRALYWQVELWIDRHPEDGRWWATVKGEIDLDDDAGNDRCVLNEQRSVTTQDEAAAAISELGEMVCSYPIGELLCMRWEPAADGSA